METDRFLNNRRYERSGEGGIIQMVPSRIEGDMFGYVSGYYGEMEKTLAGDNKKSQKRIKDSLRYDCIFTGNFFGNFGDV